MNYKLYKIHHSRGKSDTNFYQEQNILNGAYSSLKVLRVSIVSDLTNSTIHRKQKKIKKKTDDSNSMSEEEKEKSNDKEKEKEQSEDSSRKILTLIERVLLFKQELDEYFFENKIHLIKFHLNTISSIIIKNISDMQQEIITAYPVLKSSNIVRLFNNFSDVMRIFHDTKPQDFYREIKDTILDSWEKNRLQIKLLFEKIEKLYNINNDGEKGEYDFSIEHYELYYNDDEEKKKIEESLGGIEEENIKTLQKKLPEALNYILKRKKDIMNFISYMTQGMLFSISRLFYDMDYYSIIISSLAFKIFYAIMYYIDSSKSKKDNLSDKLKNEQQKVFHLMNHVIYLTYLFNINKKSGKISIYNGGLNSLSKYVLNNLIEIVSKCSALTVTSTLSKFKSPTLFQIKYKTRFYKCYPQRYKKYEDNALLRIFMLYYNSKMTFWKSILLVAKPKDNKTTITCRTCEKEIPLGDIFIHFGCCKEQQSFYDKMKLFKLKLEQFIGNLEIYLSAIGVSPIKKKLFTEGFYINNIISRIPGCENDEGENFIKKLIKLYTYEKNKPPDYYEKNPDKLYFIVSISYFSLIFFFMDKMHTEQDQDLGEIVGGVFCTLLQIFMNINFLLYVKKSKTKNNMIKFRKNQLNGYYGYNSKKDVIGDSFTLPESSKQINTKLNQLNEKILNDDLLKSDFNIKSRIEKYKMKLSLNNMFLFRNSQNSPKININIFDTDMHLNSAFVRRNAKKKMTVLVGPQLTHLKKLKKDKNTQAKKHKHIISSFYNENHESLGQQKFNSSHSVGKYFTTRPRNHSLQTKHITVRRRFSHNKLNILNYRKIRQRSKGMVRRKSHGHDVVKNNKRMMLSLLLKNDKYKEYSANKNIKNDSINHINNNSMISFSEESVTNFNNTLNLLDNDNDSNMFEFDKSLSRNEPVIHRVHSYTSRLDSIDRTCDESQKLIFNSNSNNNSFKLEDRKSNKKLIQKPSLFNNNSTEYKKIGINKKTTLFKKNKVSKEKNKNKNIDYDNDTDNNSSEINDSIGSSNGNNIFINDFEEEENKIEEGTESLKEKSSNEQYNTLISSDFKQIFPEISEQKRKSHINYDQIANIFNELMDEIEEENNINKENLSKNDLPSDSKERNKPNLKVNKSERLLDKSPNKSVKFKDPDMSLNLNTIKNTKIDESINISENTKRISKFKLILPIAKGGYGVVGLYKNVRTNDIYAIKTVDIKSMKEKHLSNTLKNEQNILKQIDSQYLVNSYFIFKDKKNYYFVMEYLPGGDVYTLLSKNTLPKKTIQLIVAETILAVNYLHNIQIIHHDIKPENILISPKGHFKLSDFGLSKTLEEDGDSSSQVVKNLKSFVEFNKIFVTLGEDENENKEAVGTLNYMAPELFTDKYPQGGGVDYWAIGVLVFDLFSFSLPFEAETQEELRNNIINVKIDWSKLINDDVTKIYGNMNFVVDFIKKFLKENPKDRWGDKNLAEIKNHKFFEGFNWNDVDTMKNDTIRDYVKQRTNENNMLIKQRMLKEKNKEKETENNQSEKKTEDGYPISIEINLTENEEKYFFTERYDNLSKKNIELFKKKIDKEVNFKENISDLMLIDLE